MEMFELAKVINYAKKFIAKLAFSINNSSGDDCEKCFRCSTEKMRSTKLN